MSYNKRYTSRYNKNFSMNGGYDTTGRWRSEAWHLDGGANDEGWHNAWCNTCCKKTEHARGGGCVTCDNRALEQRMRKVRKNPARDDRRYIFKLYENKAGKLSSFLTSLKEQNEIRCLSQKQIAAGMSILKSHISRETLVRSWVAAHRKPW
jgi:hypothetical protein